MIDAASRSPVRYARLWWRCVVLAFARETAYRGNAVLTATEGMVQLGLAVAALLLLFQYTDQVAGWSASQMLVVMGLYRLVDGIISTQIAPNMLEVSGLIRRGELDLLLLRPVSSQFLVSVRKVALFELTSVVLGLALVVVGGQLSGVTWTLLATVEALLFLLCGVTILYSLWFFLVTWTFWLIRVDTLETLFSTAMQTARYPVDVFKGAVRSVLTFVIPVAFATTFPARALLGTGDPRLIVVGLGLATGTLWASAAFWRYALRSYSSASS